VLALLLEHAGEVVSREELRHRLWADDVFVEFENNLNITVARLRRALRDSADHPRFIETIPRRGYRFLVRKVDSEPPPASSERRARLVVLPY
jgi:DNA-binding winged helix-turn-helix (wHTH) protein